MSGRIPKDQLKNGEPYNANDITLEEGGAGAVHADGDARSMRKLVLGGFLHQRSGMPIDRLYQGVSPSGTSQAALLHRSFPLLRVLRYPQDHK